MSEILDRSKNYLSIFTKSVVVDKNLPKWQEQKKQTESKNGFDNLDGIKSSIVEVENQLMSLDNFISMDKRDYNIYLGKRIANNLSKSSLYNWDLDATISIDSSAGETNGKKSIIKKITKFYKEFVNGGHSDSEEVYELNIFDFFDKVKLTAKENESKYAMRVEPYMIALKQANDMGQQALADQLTAELFNNKYESILFAEGMHYKITEDQLVDFVKKAEKGVRLDYVANFTRPIPAEIIEKKKKADQLLVFDNYCVLYYDPEGKSFSQTEAEKEKERQKKADPILFGMISGSHNLYYVADWIDEYCDLTLDEFIKVSGIDKQHLEINEKIKI